MEENNQNGNGHGQITEWLLEQIKAHGKKALAQPGAIEHLTEVFETDPLGEWQDVEAVLKEQKMDIPLIKRTIKDKIRRAKKEQERLELSAKLDASQRELVDAFAEHPETKPGDEVYEYRDGAIWFEGQRIANFNATIVADILFDDQLEPRREYEIGGQVAGETITPVGRILATEYNKGNWVDTIFGGGAWIAPRRGEHVRAAVKMHSAERERKTVYAHTGWRNDGMGWKFYHGGGAIAANGLEHADMEIDGLDMYSLPAPGTPDEMKTAWAAFEDLILSHEPHITAPLLGASLCAPVDRPRFSTFSIGETGFGKTTYNLLYLSLYGPAFVKEEKAPADWEGTLFGHQVRAHKAQNLPLLIDEYVPSTSKQAEKLRYVCAELLRSQGNLSGRTAGTVHGGLRKERYPRGLIMATGEDVPDGRSLRGRIVIVEYDIKMTAESKKKLSALQAQAREGVFARLGSAYLQWLATGARIERKMETRQAAIDELRLEWTERLTDAKVHERTSTNFASLERAWETFFEFALEKELLTDERKDEWMQYLRGGLEVCARKQAPWLTDSEPHSRFIQLIGVALSSGVAYISPIEKDGFSREEMETFGWRFRALTNGRHLNEEGEQMTERCDPMGALIGWADSEYIYLMPAAARKVADSLLPANRGLSSISQRQFDALLRNAGVIVPESTNARKVATIRKRIAKTDHEVYRFRRQTILSASYSEDEAELKD